MSDPQSPWPPPGRGQPPGPFGGYGGQPAPPYGGQPRGGFPTGPYGGQPSGSPPGAGTRFGSGGGRGPQQPGRRGRSGQSVSPRGLLWVIGILALVVILAGAHRITSTDIILFCVLVPSIILHEVTHGVVALAFGDDTAKRAGRLTLNPIAHIDPFGTLIVPALMALSGIGFFGWAKPVPVNIAKLKSPRNQGVLVSLAGPLTNVALAAAAGLLFAGLDARSAVSGNSLAIWAQVLFYLGLVNIALAAFNLIPIPPLDGSVVLERLLPRAWWPGYLRIRPYTMPILIGLVVINFYLHPGPITWLFQRLDSWWAHLLLGD